MALHLRKLLAAAIAVSSLIAFSVPSLAQATTSTSQTAHRHHSAKQHHRHHHRGIPQHNGGDQMPTTTAAPAMATATSSRLLLAAVALAAALALAGCGGATRLHTDHRPADSPGPFAWLQPAAAPADWRIARLPSRNAHLAYPPGWRAIRTDPGTFSAALLGPHDRIAPMSAVLLVPN